MTRPAPVLAISHGGGPMPALGDNAHVAITKSLQTTVPNILKLGTSEAPRAIIVITAHWSTEKVHISSAAAHEMLYDYHGFAPEAYALKHNAPGSPEIAVEVERALKDAGIDCVRDSERGWDHGVFIPMMLIDPDATIPIVQISVLASESPSESFAIGRALSSLRAQNIAIIGSGFATFHNLRLMFSGASSTPDFKKSTIVWNDMLTDAATTENIGERKQKFEGWRNWPGSYTMHPKGGAEHFLPLIVCAGAGAQSKAQGYCDDFMGVDHWTYYWSEDPPKGHV